MSQNPAQPQPPPDSLSDAALLRYAGHIMLPDFDVAGQQALVEAHVLVIGVGGLGAAAALYLAAAGIGTLTLADDDRVSHSNLQRQIIHGEANIGELKVLSAQARLQAINPDCRILILPIRLTGAPLQDAVGAADLVVDCCDNFATRSELNRACLAHRTPWISAAAIRTQGQLSLFDPRQPDSPCYQCLHPEPPEDETDCATTGVLGPLVGVFGSLEAAEAIKLLAGFGKPLVGQLLTVDLQDMEWRTFRLPKRPACPACG